MSWTPLCVIAVKSLRTQILQTRASNRGKRAAVAIDQKEQERDLRKQEWQRSEGKKQVRESSQREQIHQRQRRNQRLLTRKRCAFSP